MRRARDEQWDVEFIVYSRDEQKHAIAQRNYPNARYVLGDVLDTGRLCLVAGLCDYVIHAAAIKYIPECEEQPSEAIRVNLDGARSVIDACRAAKVKRCVMISTDKAAAPVNTYGMTKALTERLVFETAAIDSPTVFTACRYGNVIGSTGSVWPAFKRQREQQGYLTVTDPNMTRFFTPVDEAVDIISFAMNEALPGTVVIPEPSALRIGSLADHLTSLWSLAQPEIMGRRPGEKSHEAMIDWTEYERMIPVLARTDYWTLLGPTIKAGYDRSDKLARMTSDHAKQLTPERFVEYADDSESV